MNLMNLIAKNPDIQTSSCLKGILACMVLLSHLHGRVSLFSHSILGTLFTAFGYLAVSAFFFLSGCGLQCSMTAKTDYIKTFPRRKLLPFFLICCFTILIYLLRDLLLTRSVDALRLLQSFFFAGTIVDNGWYLQAQILFYVIFYLISRYCLKQSNVLLPLTIIIYCVFCAAIGLPTTWYEASLCFPLGVLFAKHCKSDSANTPSKLRFFLTMAVMLLAFVVTLLLGNKSILPEPLRIAVKMLSSALFTILLMAVVSKINIKNPITTFLGSICLEIYLLQGLFLNVFQKQLPIENDWLYMAAVTASTLVLSRLLHPVYKRLNQIGK